MQLLLFSSPVRCITQKWCSMLLIYSLERVICYTTCYIEIWTWLHCCSSSNLTELHCVCQACRFNSCQRCCSKVLSRLCSCTSVYLFNQLAKLQANFFILWSLVWMCKINESIHKTERWKNVEQVKWCEFLRCAVQTSVSNNDCMIVCSPVSGLERLKTRKMPWDFTPCRSPINETENLPRATSPSGTAGAYWPCWRLPAAPRSSPVWLSGNRFVNADMQTGCCVCWDVVRLRCLTRPSHGVSDFRQSD